MKAQQKWCSYDTCMEAYQQEPRDLEPQRPWQEATSGTEKFDFTVVGPRELPRPLWGEFVVL